MRISKILLLGLLGVATVTLAKALLKSPEGKLFDEKFDKILVFKSKRELHLLRNRKIVRTYKIALGDNPKGHKLQEGDERTPEGFYILDWRNANSSCYKSLHISYPNHQDKEKARRKGISPGGNIMIHGLHPSIAYLGRYHSLFDWTNGCVAVTNHEMDEIWRSAKNETPIEIRK